MACTPSANAWWPSCWQGWFGLEPIVELQLHALMTAEWLLFFHDQQWLLKTLLAAVD
ncbi:MAG: hypothetical protein VKO65_03440 [Cyanobacteriota bacterium]|nr:hypothetical protein [Cyanobacteriota bacterium]